MRVDPRSLPRRTPLRSALDALGAGWRSLGDSAIAAGIPQVVDAKRLAIVDLSPFPRLGFKGRGTVPAMQTRGLTLEPKANQAYRQADGSLCLVLAPSEIILLSNLTGDGTRLREMAQSWRLEDEERTYPMPRQDSHAWFLITGELAPMMFAKICGIDLRLKSFPDLAITQTSVAKITGIITRSDLGLVPAFHVLADSASALYFSECLVDAAQEFGGGLAGLETVEALLRHENPY